MARADAEEEKQCWVCFATEEDDPTAVWVHPCKYVLAKEGSSSCMNSSYWLPWLYYAVGSGIRQPGNRILTVQIMLFVYLIFLANICLYVVLALKL